MSATIRPYEPSDADDCYEICLRTGDHGNDASALYTDPRLIGEFWVGPYLERWPQHAFVVGDGVVGDGGSVGGYIVGAPDTAEHERWLEEDWLPPLRRRYPLDMFPAGTADAEVVELIHHPPKNQDLLATDWPAHLHIDLLPGWQRRGYGTALMNVFFASLRTAGVSGVHLGVSPQNLGAIAFYQHIGFQNLYREIVWGRTTEPI